MFKRGIVILLISATLLMPLFAVKASDLGGSWAQATAFITKEYGLDLLARAIARPLLNSLVSGLITKIQRGGRDGGPAFVQNWRNFQTDAQYRGENVFRSILASTPLCDYVSTSIKGVFGANQKVPSAGQNLRVNNFDPFALRASCTMPSNFNLQNYQNDFSGNGGWNAWSRMLEPQNNYYGLLFGSLDEASRQRALEESGDMNEALSGSGYTSIRDKNCAGTGEGAKCVFMGKIFTPGDLLGKSAASTIDADLQWLISSDELSEVIISVVTASVNRLANLALSSSADDYTNAPRADSDSSAFNACSSTCGRNSQCLSECARQVSQLIPNLDTPPPSGGEGTPPPPDSLERHPDQTGAVQAAKDSVVGDGIPLDTDCNIFEIVKRAAGSIGAGVLIKPSGRNCGGFAVDIITFPDGYIYDVLIGSDPGGALAPTWSPVGCDTSGTGPPGTCTDRYSDP